MHLLFLDDSGKPDANHPSKFMVLAGFSVSSDKYHDVVRQVTGAKNRFFPGRGNPNSWELKTEDFLKRNPYNRAKNRHFCEEVISILDRNGCRIYSGYINKANAVKSLDEKWVTPLLLQNLLANYSHELTSKNSLGVITCDWSTHKLDRHLSNCVQSQLISKGVTNILGGVSYGSSISLVPIQICDLLAGLWRMSQEGATHLNPLITAARNLTVKPNGGTRNFLGFPNQSEIQLF
jgi:hypothetical protein